MCLPLDCSHLVLYLICICGWSVSIFIGVQSSNKLIVVNVTVSVSIKDVRYCSHLQLTGGKLCTERQEFICHLMSFDAKTTAEVSDPHHKDNKSNVSTLITYLMLGCHR